MLNFTTADEVFRLSRKQAAHKERLRHDPQRTRWRYITAVRPMPSVPVRCVQIDSADWMYLAGRNMVPTHNSTLALDLARAASIKHGLAEAIRSSAPRPQFAQRGFVRWAKGLVGRVRPNWRWLAARRSC